MESRRNFINKTGKGVLLATVAPSISSEVLASQQQKITIGIIGAENSHTIGFGKLFNIDKKFPGVELKYVWGETDALAKKAMEQKQNR